MRNIARITATCLQHTRETLKQSWSVVMATNPEKIKQEALASLEQLTEMAEARLKDQITERQVGTMMMLTKTTLPKTHCQRLGKVEYGLPAKI